MGMRCDQGKRRFPSHHAAIVELINLNYWRWLRGRLHGKIAVRAYRCPFCGAWHITSQPPRGRRAGGRSDSVIPGGPPPVP